MQDPWGVAPAGNTAAPPARTPDGFFKNALAQAKATPAPVEKLGRAQRTPVVGQTTGRDPVTAALGAAAHWIGNPLHPHPQAMTDPATGKPLPLNAGTVLTPVTAAINTLRQLPAIVSGAHNAAVAVAHAKQPPSFTGDVNLILSGALGIPRGGMNEEPPVHPLLAKPTIIKGSPVPTVKTLPETIKEALQPARGLRAEQESLRSPVRGERAQAFGKALQENPTAAGAKAARGELAGKYPAVHFGGFEHFTPEAHDAMVKFIADHPNLKPFEPARATVALEKVRAGILPQRNEEVLLRKVFGLDTTKELMTSVSKFRQLKALGYDVANIPRSVMASYDASGVLRQALMIATGHPGIWAKNVPDYLKAIRSEDFYNAGMETLHARPNALSGLYEKMGVDLTELSPRGSAVQREEAFRSPLAEKIPGIRMSGRGFTLFLDKARADLADHMYELAMKNQGKLVRRVELVNGKPKIVARPLDPNDPHLLQSIGDVVNSMSGRGDLGNGVIGRSQEGLNLLLFSPRLIKSRLDFLNPVWYAKLDPLARHQAYKAMGGLVVLMTTAMGIAKAAGAPLNLDPRSSDFAKIKIGNTRIDLGGGFQQYIRLLSEIESQQTVNSGTGKVTNLGPEGPGKTSDWDVLFRFLRAKLAPLSSAAVDATQQRNSVGQPLTWQNSILSRLTPLAGQDAVSVGQDAAQSTHSVPLGIAAGLGGGLLSAFGGGVQNYQAKPTKVKGSDPWGVGGGGSSPNPFAVGP